MARKPGWHYSGWTGVMYGNIPVGIILTCIAVVVFLMLR